MPPFWKRKRVAPVMDPDTELVERAIQPLWDTYLDSPERLTTEQATLMDVWSTVGAVLNGGLMQFTETSGQRGSQTVNAFRNIGLEAYADVVERTLRLYTTASADDPDERLSASSAWQDGGPEDHVLDALDDEAEGLSADRAVERAAAAFVSQHRGHFFETAEAAMCRCAPRPPVRQSHHSSRAGSRV